MHPDLLFRADLIGAAQLLCIVDFTEQACSTTAHWVVWAKSFGQGSYLQKHTGGLYVNDQVASFDEGNVPKNNTN